MIAKVMRQKRIEKGLSQGDLAKRLGYSSPQFVSNWERGVSKPPAHAGKALCKALGISRKEFVAMLVEHERRRILKALK